MTEDVPSRTPRETQTWPSQTVAQWLLAATIVLILYVSLFPFEFNAPRAGLTLLELAASLTFERSSRGDVVANLLLYVPLGLCMAIALARRCPVLLNIAITVATGALLSISVELLQTMETARVASLTDVLLNTVSTAIGAIGLVLYFAIGTHLSIPGLIENRPAPVPLGFVVLWLSYRLAPFVPTLDWQKIKDSLKSVLLAPDFQTFEVLRFLVGWLVIAHAVRLVWQREYAFIALLALATGTQIGRIVVVGKTLNLSELIALAAMFALLPFVARLPTARRLLVLAYAVAVVIVIQGLEPWQFDVIHHDFSWVPFKNSLSGSLWISISVLLEKCFWYASLVWVLMQRTRSLTLATVVTALLIGVIEFVQIWLPGRSAEITDPLLALAAAGLLGLGAASRESQGSQSNQTVRGVSLGSEP